MWSFPRFKLIVGEEPTVALPGGVTRIVNLRGATTPPYEVPRNVVYCPLFLEGGPTANVPYWKINTAVRLISETRGGGVCFVHCQHGLNRTGLVACAAAVLLAGQTVDAAVQMFATLRPPGIRRPRVIKTLRGWSRSGAHRKKKFTHDQKHGRVHRSSVFHHRSSPHIGQHPVHVERSGRERLFAAHERVGHRHRRHVRDKIHERPPAKAPCSPGPQQDKEGVVLHQLHKYKHVHLALAKGPALARATKLVQIPPRRGGSRVLARPNLGRLNPPQTAHADLLVDGGHDRTMLRVKSFSQCAHTKWHIRREGVKNTETGHGFYVRGKK